MYHFCLLAFVLTLLLFRSLQNFYPGLEGLLLSPLMLLHEFKTLLFGVSFSRCACYLSFSLFLFPLLVQQVPYLEIIKMRRRRGWGQEMRNGDVFASFTVQGDLNGLGSWKMPDTFIKK